MWRLRVLKGAGRFESEGGRHDELWLSELPLMLGRNVESSPGALLAGDPAVSRHHALFSERQGVLHLRNESRTNPIWVNGQLVNSGHEVALGKDKVCQIGRTLILVDEALPPEGIRLRKAPFPVARRSPEAALETEPVAGTYVLVALDTVESTHIRQEIGDAPIEEWLTFLLHRARQLNCLYIRGTGDGAFLLFREVGHAFALAVSVMKFLAVRNRSAGPEEAVHVRGGIHYGTVRPSPLSGYASLSLDFVYRITSIDPTKDLGIPARGVSREGISNIDRIWFSEAIDRMNVGGRWPTRKLGWFQLRHVKGLHPLFELRWQEVAPESLQTPVPAAQTA